MLDELVREQQVSDLRIRGNNFGDGLEVVGSFDFGVPFLHEGSAQHRAELDGRRNGAAGDEDDAVLLLLESLESFGRIVGSDDDLEEDLVDLFCHRLVDRNVGDDDASES